MTQNQQEYLISHIVDKMANYLIEDFHLDIPSALNVIYTSDTYRILSDTENDLYSQSPSYVYEWLKQEFLTGKCEYKNFYLPHISLVLRELLYLRKMSQRKISQYEKSI